MMKSRGGGKIVKLVLVGILIPMFLPTISRGGAAAQPLPHQGRVKAVFDGDTILLESGEKIRYLGIDAPETAHDDSPADCMGDEAREANARLVLHRSVTLRYDEEKRDRYGRLLAYVHAPDGTCVNEALLRSGHAFVFRKNGGLRRFREFLRVQREAMGEHRGLWGECSVKLEDFYLGNENSFVFHRPDCHYGKRMSRRNRVRFDSRLSAFHEGYRPCRRCKP